MTSPSTLLRLLAVAASLTAACAGAQPIAPGSSVTLYGVLDACLVNYHGGNGPRWQVNGGGCFYGSRLGFRGIEDLGGGAKAYFILESGFFADNGTLNQNGRIFGRKSLVGLSGSMGNIEAGRDYAPAFYLLTVIDPMQLGPGSALATIWSGSPGTASGRTDNQVSYLSPDFNGLTLRAQYALGEQTPPASSRGGDARGANALYRKGPLLLGASYETIRNTTSTGSDHAATIGGKYDFGPFSLAFLAQSGGWAGTRTAAVPAVATSIFSRRFNSYQVGGTVRTGGSTSVVFAYKRYDDRTVSNFDADVWSVMYIYPFSKRTWLYAGATQLKNRKTSSYTAADGNGAYTGVDPGGRSRPIELGITHLF